MAKCICKDVFYTNTLPEILVLKELDDIIEDFNKRGKEDLVGLVFSKCSLTLFLINLSGFITV